MGSGNSKPNDAVRSNLNPSQIPSVSGSLAPPPPPSLPQPPESRTPRSQTNPEDAVRKFSFLPSNNSLAGPSTSPPSPTPSISQPQAGSCSPPDENNTGLPQNIDMDQAINTSRDEEFSSLQISESADVPPDSYTENLIAVEVLRGELEEVQTELEVGVVHLQRDYDIAMIKLHRQIKQATQGEKEALQGEIASAKKQFVMDIAELVSNQSSREKALRQRLEDRECELKAQEQHRGHSECAVSGRSCQPGGDAPGISLLSWDELLSESGPVEEREAEGDGQRQRTPFENAADCLNDIDRLVESLRCDYDQESKLQALEIIYYLTLNPSNEIIVAQNGAIPLLVQILRKGTEEGQLFATAILGNLATDRDVQLLIAQAGAVLPLVEILKTGSLEAVTFAAGAFMNITSIHPGICSQAITAGVVSPLVDVLKSGTIQGRKRAAVALNNLSLSFDDEEMSMVTAGATESLVSLLVSSTLDNISRKQDCMQVKRRRKKERCRMRTLSPLRQLDVDQNFFQY